MGICELQKGKTGADHQPASERLATEPKKVPVLIFILPSDGNSLVRTWGNGGAGEGVRQFFYTSL